MQPKPRWLGGNGWLLDGPEEALQGTCRVMPNPTAEPGSPHFSGAPRKLITGVSLCSGRLPVLKYLACLDPPPPTRKGMAGSWPGSQNPQNSVGFDCPWQWGLLPGWRIQREGAWGFQIPQITIRGSLFPADEASFRGGCSTVSERNGRQAQGPGALWGCGCEGAPLRVCSCACDPAYIRVRDCVCQGVQLCL